MQSGQKIRGYVLEEMIGEGGMGEVWRARHEVLQRQVAIKVMSRQIATNSQFGERFIQEARAQAVLQHPRILGVTDFFSEGNVHYLVMPLVIGPSLEERMRQVAGPLPQDEALAIARDLLDALDYAHQRGIIHRDVKPSNILLDRAGYAYLTDFGIALLVGQQRLTRTGSLLGTREYMSPEQIRNPRTLDHRTDVYSAGCVIYEMLAGRPPFIGDQDDADSTDFAVMEAHVRQPPEPLRKWNPAIPVNLDYIVLQALAKAPDQRFAGCGEFRRVLENWDRYEIDDVAVHHQAPILSPPAAGTGSGPLRLPALPAKASPSRAPKIVAIVIAALLLIAVIVAVANGRRQEESADHEEVNETTEMIPMDTDMVEEMETGIDTNLEPMEPMGTDMAEIPTPPPADSPPESNSEASPDPNQELVQKLDRYAAAQLPGFESDQSYFGSLVPNGQERVRMELQEGEKYGVIAVCDSSCSDIDIALFDSLNKQIAKDGYADDHPMVIMTTSESGSYYLDVTMYSCSQTVCNYGFQVYKSTAMSPP